MNTPACSLSGSCLSASVTLEIPDHSCAALIDVSAVDRHIWPGSEPVAYWSSPRSKRYDEDQEWDEEDEDWDEEDEEDDWDEDDEDDEDWDDDEDEDDEDWDDDEDEDDEDWEDEEDE